MLKAMIFDMDGVLIDSTRYIWESFNILLKDTGVHFTDADIKKYTGHSLRDKLKLWEKDYGLTGYNLEKFSKDAGEIELAIMKKRLHPNKALNQFLKEAKDNGIKLAVATSSLRWRADRIIDLLGIRGYFDSIVSAEDVKNHKPDPDIFLEAARRLNEKPTECIVFEDAVNGIEAAKAGNMKVIAMRTGVYSDKELKGADLIIKDFSDVDIRRLARLF